MENILNLLLNLDKLVNKYSNFTIIFGIKLDKFIHIFFIIIIGIIFYNLFKFLKLNYKNNLILIIIILIFISIGKEFFDFFYKKTFFSFGDLLADLIGFIIFLIILKFLKVKK